MSGTIETSPKVYWSASSWLFDWVLRTMADEVTDADLVASLLEIVEENLGWLSLNEFGEQKQIELERVVRGPLLPRASLASLGGPDSHDRVMALLGELVDQVGGRGP